MPVMRQLVGLDDRSHHPGFEGRIRRAGKPSDALHAMQSSQGRLMSTTALSLVFENSKQDGSAMLIMVAIADSINRETRSTFLSLDYLAKKARVGRRTLLDHLPDLEKSGELTIDHGAGPRGCNIYSLGPFYRWGADFALPPAIVEEALVAPATSGGSAGGAPVRSAYAVSHPYLLVPSLDLGPEEPMVIDGKGANSALGSAPLSDESRWARALEELKRTISRSVFVTFIERTQVVSLVDGIATIACVGEDRQSQAAWLNDRMRTTAKRILMCEEVRFVVAEPAPAEAESQA